MTPLLLILSIAALFAILLVYESAGDGTHARLKPAGLLTWLVSGNWPAKVGAGLVIVGVGALLRYAFANIDVPPELKLGSGVVVAAALGLAALVLKNQPKRRAIYLALAGAGFGVAYLTAYSAYGFFNYINDINALALLALVAVSAGVFAVTTNVMSVAILAMVGAYVAPKFAIGSPDVLPVYGYYLAASILSLIMVTLRGWRPLIHLSFLFTLAGALFFGWSGKFYEPEHYRVMQPLLLGLTVVHLLMPLLERKHVRSVGLIRFDLAYFILLPLVAAGLTLKISPDVHSEGAMGLGALALIWLVTAAVLYLLKSGEILRHAGVAVLLAAVAIFCYVQDLPWLLVGLGLSVLTMGFASKLGCPRRVEEFACGGVAVFGLLHISQSIFEPLPAQIFLNEMFAFRMVAGAMLMVGAWIGMRQSMTFAKVLGVAGLGWAVLSITGEVWRLHIDFLPQLVYGLLLGVIAIGVLLGNKLAEYPLVGGLLMLALVCCGWWAMHDASVVVIIACLAMTFASLLGMAWSGRDSERKDRSDFSPSMAVGILPFALLPWAIATAEIVGIKTDLFEAGIAMAGIVMAGLSARYWLSGSPRWNDRIQPLHVYFTAFGLLWVTLFHIERGVWPVLFEVLALGYLIAYVTRRSREQSGVGLGVGAMMVLSVALFLQAMLLRGFGPNEVVLDASDINKMHLPAVASLMWVIFGAGLAWWGTHNKSRSIWSAGSVLLAVAAAKLVLFDFGTLGQLGNILAFIAAGVVFMGVAWFAPIPPKAERAPIPPPDMQPVAPPFVPRERVPEQPVGEKTPPRQAASRSESKPQPASVYQTTKSSIENEFPAESAQRNRQGKAIPARRYRGEPKGINGLWFLLMGLAILIALSLSAWNKQIRLQKLRQDRQKVVDIQRKSENQPAPAPSASVSDPTLLTPSMPARYAKPDAPVDFAQPVKLVDACARFAEQLQGDYVLYAAGAYSGKKIAFQIDQSGHEGTQMDVTVNSPNKPVVLMLGAYEPTIWNISWTQETKILGVLASGYHRQVVAGLEKSTPSLVSTYDNRGPCGYFYLSTDNLASLNPFAKRAFGRPVDLAYPAINGKIEVGAPIIAGVRLNSSSEAPPESFYDKSAPVAGIAGLEDAVRKGVLRKATAADAEAWSEAVAHSSPKRDIPPIAGQGVPNQPKPQMYNAYVVLNLFTYPSGLYGAHSATFIIPKGVAIPQGNSGHSVVYDFNTLTCQGVQCTVR